MRTLNPPVSATRVTVWPRCTAFDATSCWLLRMAPPEMGRAAAQMLGEIIEDRPLRSRRVELSTELITRESTGPVPGTER